MFKDISKKTLLLIASIVVAGILIGGAIVFISVRKCSGITNNGKVLTSQEAGNKVIGFVNKEMLHGKVTGSLISSTEENNLYNIVISIQGKKYNLYTTLDGKFLYPERIDMEKAIAQSNDKENNQESAKKTCSTIKKAEKPLMEVFVVSSCPFGLQAQRILAEIGKNIPSLTNEVKIRYIGSVSNNKIISMHGDKEAKENLRQICIRNEQPDKYWNYVSCYIKAGKTDECLKSVSIDSEKLNTCMSDSSRGLKYAKEDFALQNKYSVTGSPTLILNGEKVSEFDFGGRNAEAVKTLLCCGFSKTPDFCSKKLTTNSAATSFSEKYSSGTGGASGNCK